MSYCHPCWIEAFARSVKEWNSTLPIYEQVMCEHPEHDHTNLELTDEERKALQ